MFIGKIVKSDSHINYVCQIYGPREVEAQPGPADYAFGRFVRVAVRSQRASIRLNHRTWAQLVAELEPVNADGLGIVARDYLEPRKGQIELEPSSMWTLLGGDAGLKRMRANADRLVALAAFAQRRSR